MLRYTLSTYGALSIVFHSLIALGDLGPYFKSISYEHAGYGKWPYQSYQSSDSIGPVLNIHRFDDKCDNGQYIFLSPTGHEIRSSLPTILDGHGNLVWTSRYHGNWGLDVQMMDEQPYLTFCASRGLLVDPTCYMVGTCSAVAVKYILKGKQTVNTRIRGSIRSQAKKWLDGRWHRVPNNSAKNCGAHNVDVDPL
jgi:hypothetical protein